MFNSLVDGRTKFLTNRNIFNTSHFKFVFDSILGKITNIQENKKFKMKYYSHTNSIFKIYKLNNSVYEEQDSIISLTNTRNPVRQNGWVIGELHNGQIQYLNKNYIGEFNNSTFQNLKKNQSNLTKDLEMVEGIKYVISNNKENLDIVTDDLSTIYQQNSIKNKLSECIQNKSTDVKCIEYYKIAYGDGWIAIVEHVLNITN